MSNKSFAFYSPETPIAASGSYTFEPSDLHNCELHTITVIAGSGTCKIEGTPRVKGGADGSAVVSMATGLTAVSYDTYVYSGLNAITITETGGANSITVIIKSYNYN